MNAHIVARGPKDKKGRRGPPYSVVIEMGSKDGKRDQRWLSGYKTKQAAQDAMTDILRELRTGQYVDPTDLTVAGWLDAWSERDWGNLKPKTRDTYRQTVVEVTAHIGALPLQKLSTERIQDMVNHWHTVGSKALTRGTAKPLKQSTIGTHMRCLNAALNRAVELEYISRNRAAKVTIPRDEGEEGEYPVLAADEVDRLIEASRLTEVFIPTLIAVTTGLSRAETLGLKWADLEGDTLTVKRNAVKPRGQAVILDTPKTKSRKRSVYLLPFVVTELQAHKRKQNAHRLQMGNTWQDNDLICCGDFGAPMSPDWVTQQFRRFAKANGFKVTFHGLRHTQATLLISGGASMKSVQARLGHSKIGMTMDTYTSVTRDMQRETVDVLERVMGGAR